MKINDPRFFSLGFFLYISLVVKKKENIEDLNGLTLRHVAQIVRRKMIQKDHGNKKAYTRKKKHKGKEDE